MAIPVPAARACGSIRSIDASSPSGVANPLARIVKFADLTVNLARDGEEGSGLSIKADRLLRPLRHRRHESEGDGRLRRSRNSAGVISDDFSISRRYFRVIKLKKRLTNAMTVEKMDIYIGAIVFYSLIGTETFL